MVDKGVRKCEIGLDVSSIADVVLVVDGVTEAAATAAADASAVGDDRLVLPE